MLSGMVVLAILAWVFPPFHLRSLKAVHAAQAGAQLNVTNVVATFWKDKLLTAAEHATDANKVLDSISLNPQKAREQFGRSVEIGSTYYYFVRGTGCVVTVSEDWVGIALKGVHSADISIPLGLIFGNALRDGTGLLNASDYPNSQQFNDIAAGLNRLVETEVLAGLQKRVKVGTPVQFAGCAEVADEDQDLKPLKVIPVYIRIE
jgi:predicted lipoprotein